MRNAMLTIKCCQGRQPSTKWKQPSSIDIWKTFVDAISQIQEKEINSEEEKKGHMLAGCGNWKREGGGNHSWTNFFFSLFSNNSLDLLDATIVLPSVVPGTQPLTLFGLIPNLFPSSHSGISCSNRVEVSANMHLQILFLMRFHLFFLICYRVYKNTEAIYVNIQVSNERFQLIFLSEGNLRNLSVKLHKISLSLTTYCHFLAKSLKQ